MVSDSYDLFLLDLNISNHSVTALVTLIPFPLIHFSDPLRLRLLDGSCASEINAYEVTIPLAPDEVLQ